MGKLKVFLIISIIIVVITLIAAEDIVISGAKGIFFYISNETGNIGIGTENPSAKLDVRGEGNFSGTIYINNNTDVSDFALINRTTNGRNVTIRFVN